MEIKVIQGFGNRHIGKLAAFYSGEPPKWEFAEDNPRITGTYTTWELWHDGKFQLTTSAIVPTGKEKEYDDEIRNKLIDKWKKQ